MKFHLTTVAGKTPLGEDIIDIHMTVNGITKYCAVPADSFDTASLCEDTLTACLHELIKQCYPTKERK